MVLEKPLEGQFVDLRSVEERDAEVILTLRNDPRISRYLPPLKISPSEQRTWIEKQRSDNDSYYFMIVSKSGDLLGTISVYNIEDNHAETGRICSVGDPHCNVEALLLINDFVFNVLKLDYTTSWVLEENKSIVRLNEKIGSEWYDSFCAADGRKCLAGRRVKEQYQKKSKAIRETLYKLASAQSIVRDADKFNTTRGDH